MLQLNGNKRGDIKMKKEVKSRKHILCEKAPLVAMILAAALALAVLTIPGLFGLSDVANNLASSVLAVLFLIAYTRWFAPEFKGVFKTSHLATGLAFVWLAFAFKFFGAYFVNLADNGFYFKPTVVAFAMAIAAGFYEETIFRGVTVPIGMRYFKSEKRVGILVLIWYSALCTLETLRTVRAYRWESLKASLRPSQEYFSLLYFSGPETY